MSLICRWAHDITHRIKWWKWFLLDGPNFADPRFVDGEQRRTNIRIAIERWKMREPRDFQK